MIWSDSILPADRNKRKEKPVKMKVTPLSLFSLRRIPALGLNLDKHLFTLACLCIRGKVFLKGAKKKKKKKLNSILMSRLVPTFLFQDFFARNNLSPDQH